MMTKETADSEVWRVEVAQNPLHHPVFLGRPDGFACAS